MNGSGRAKHVNMSTAHLLRANYFIHQPQQTTTTTTTTPNAIQIKDKTRSFLHLVQVAPKKCKSDAGDMEIVEQRCSQQYQVSKLLDKQKSPADKGLDGVNEEIADSSLVSFFNSDMSEETQCQCTLDSPSSHLDGGI